MASNSFGKIFKITTFGESHGRALGVTVDGCPAGIEISSDDINQALVRRAPGNNPYTSPRKEPDNAELLSGVFEGKTTGAPLSIVIFNKDQDSSKYEPIKNLLRPGHANYTYLSKYGIFDYRGGGRSSARETAARVAAGAIAEKILDHYNIKVLSFIKSLYHQQINISTDELISQCYQGAVFSLDNYKKIFADINSSPIFSPDKATEAKMMELITNIKDNGDSLGGIVELMIFNCPVGLGDPVYDKIEARLASAMMSIPATKGFEIGNGFAATQLLGSENNDEFICNQETKQIGLKSNSAGGTLGGISSGEPIIARIAFKPTSSINLPQNTVDIDGNEAEFKLPEGSRHDPCVALRAVPVVNAMASIVIADLLLTNRLAKL